jgi:hypothetical protein
MTYNDGARANCFMDICLFIYSIVFVRGNVYLEAFLDIRLKLFTGLCFGMDLCLSQIVLGVVDQNVFLNLLEYW